MKTNFQYSLSFPDWNSGKVDDTLAMNNMIGFTMFHGQGYIYVTPHEPVRSFRLFVNNAEIDVSGVKTEERTMIDISGYTRDGMNSLMVLCVKPEGLRQVIDVDIPYPVVLEGDLEEAGIDPKVMKTIEKIVESDVENGFTSAQLAIVKDGRLVYRNCWGKLNSYEQDGKVKEDSPMVTDNTLYDLASNSKMYATNFAIQYLVSEGLLDVEKHVTDYVGERFAEDVIDLTYEGCENPGLETQKEWKRSLKISDILRHQAGFPADPRYYYERYDQGKRMRADVENVLYSGDDGSDETRRRTLDCLCRTPMMYRPGTQTIYSDADYMLLGLIVEQITEMPEDEFLRKVFWKPMGLKHICMNPLKHGFKPEDCAATELNGNTRDGVITFKRMRTETLQGTVHDEKAWCCLGGVAGHAGLFASATDLATLASVMLSGGYGEHRFFSKDVMDNFTSPKSSTAANWGLGWNRQGDMERSWYFSPLSCRNTIGHQGWTGTLSMIDPERNLVMILLTNKINSRITDTQKDPNRFNGNWYTTSTLGFVSELIYAGFMGELSEDVLKALLMDMVQEKQKLVIEAGEAAKDPNHPIRRAYEAIKTVAESI